MRRIVTTFWIAAAAVAFTADSTQAQQSIRTGPAVGERLPEFRLPDHKGKQQDLQSIAGPKGAVIVFIRSADW